MRRKSDGAGDPAALLRESAFIRPVGGRRSGRCAADAIRSTIAHTHRPRITSRSTMIESEPEGDPASESLNGLTSKDKKRISEYAEHTLHPRTRRQYEAIWERFAAFCEERGVSPLPATPEIIAAYLADRAQDLAAVTVSKDSYAISWKHKQKGLRDPTLAPEVRTVLKGIRQTADPDEGYGKRKALLTEEIQAVIRTLPLEEPSSEVGPKERAKYLRALRTRALFLVGYAGGFRASELIAIRMRDIALNESGMDVHVPEAKNGPRDTGISHATDPDFCPVHSLRAWVEAVGIKAGPVFRRVRHSAEVPPDDTANPIGYSTLWRDINITAEAADIDSDQVGPHSLRRGHVTQAKLNGVDIDRIRRHVGHKHLEVTVGYVEDVNRMETNTSQELGL